MSVLSATFDYLHLQDQGIAWKLLRAKNAPVIIAVLDAHLGGSNRRLVVAELESLVAVDIEELRLRSNIELPRSPKAYCDSWREDGYLVRRPLPQTRQETYELSAGALAAITFVKQLVQPRRTATQSRLSTIINQIRSLALATDGDESSRRDALLEERARIDSQLKQLEEGQLPAIEYDQALEQAQDIISLAQEIPRDFVRVRDDFEQINSSLYATIINYQEGHRDVLEDIFSGVDQIAQSPSGRSFKGLYALLRDVEQTETIQDDIDAILDNDFAKELSSTDRQFLRNLLQEFRQQGQEVNAVMTSFAQGLRRFVQNQDYLQDRVLKQLIDKALGKAGAVLKAHPAAFVINTNLDLTSVKLHSVSRYALKNPFETKAEAIQEIKHEVIETIALEDLIALARETEIDFSELADSVNQCLREGDWDERAGVSVGEVLQKCPATQGVASVVGLIVLAFEQGRIGTMTEKVSWLTEQEQRRQAEISRLEFYREVFL